MNKKLPIYKLIIKKDGSDSGVSAIALVNEPAIEIDFFAFKNESITTSKFQFKTLNEDKQILAGPLMVPDKLIYRKEGNNEYFVVFDKDTIEMIAEKFNKNKMQSNFNAEHSENKILQNVFVKENWIVESAEFDKSKQYGFEPIVGCWFGVIKVDDKNIWNEYVKTGQVKGFSVEGDFEMVFDKILSDEFKKIMPVKVGFDFDNTVSLIIGQQLAKEEIEKGNTVYIITAKDKHKSKNVYRVAEKLGIPQSNIRFTNGKEKIVDVLKGLGISKWYDNDQTQCDFVNQHSDVKAIKFESVSPFTGLFKKIGSRKYI